MAGTLTLQNIRALKTQGLSNTQIIHDLQRQGYTSTQIFTALNQEGMQPATPWDQQTQENATPQPLNSPQSTVNTMQEVPSSMNTPRVAQARPAQPPGFAQESRGQNATSQEELIEAIIDEKWNDLLEDVQRIISWKEKTSEQITTLETQMKDLKEQFERLHKAVVGKVGEYDQHILQVGAEVKAMEKVFSKVLPVFTENVGELSRVADSLKASVPKKSARK